MGVEAETEGWLAARGSGKKQGGPSLGASRWSQPSPWKPPCPSVVRCCSSKGPEPAGKACPGRQLPPSVNPSPHPLPWCDSVLSSLLLGTGWDASLSPHWKRVK